MHVENKIAFIAGGSTGIGFAIGKQLAQQGAKVVLLARDILKLQQAKKSIQHETAKDVVIFSVDLSDNKNSSVVLENAVSTIGIPDILINCVGIARPNYFEQIDYVSFDKVMKSNLYSLWNSTSLLLPYMKQKRGAIVNTSSIAGFIGVFGYTDYSLTKFGIIGFSEALRAEMKKYNITVQVVCPPDTDTPGFEEENKSKPEETRAIGGKAKLMQADAVAHAVCRQLGKSNFMILPGMDAKSTWLLKRLFPRIVEWIMDKSVRSVQQK